MASMPAPQPLCAVDGFTGTNEEFEALYGLEVAQPPEQLTSAMWAYLPGPSGSAVAQDTIFDFQTSQALQFNEDFTHNYQLLDSIGEETISHTEIEGSSAPEDFEQVLSNPGDHMVMGLYGDMWEQTIVHGSNEDINQLQAALSSGIQVRQDGLHEDPISAFKESICALQKEGIFFDSATVDRTLEWVVDAPPGDRTLKRCIEVIRNNDWYGKSRRAGQLGILTFKENGQLLFQLRPADQFNTRPPYYTVFLSRGTSESTESLTVWGSFMKRIEESYFDENGVFIQPGTPAGRAAKALRFAPRAPHLIGARWRVPSTTQEPKKAPVTKHPSHIKASDYAHLTVDELVSGSIHSEELKGGNILRVGLYFTNQELQECINYLRQNIDDPPRPPHRSNMAAKIIAAAQKAMAADTGESQADIGSKWDQRRLAPEEQRAARARRGQLGKTPQQKQAQPRDPERAERKRRRAEEAPDEGQGRLSRMAGPSKKRTKLAVDMKNNGGGEDLGEGSSGFNRGNTRALRREDSVMRDAED